MPKPDGFREVKKPLTCLDCRNPKVDYSKKKVVRCNKFDFQLPWTTVSLSDSLVKYTCDKIDPHQDDEVQS